MEFSVVVLQEWLNGMVFTTEKHLQKIVLNSSWSLSGISPTEILSPIHLHCSLTGTVATFSMKSTFFKAHFFCIF